jgi:hypothetical protein
MAESEAEPDCAFAIRARLSNASVGCVATSGFSLVATRETRANVRTLAATNPPLVSKEALLAVLE